MQINCYVPVESFYKRRAEKNEMILPEKSFKIIWVRHLQCCKYFSNSWILGRAKSFSIRALSERAL